jgi:hypothetical protein
VTCSIFFVAGVPEQIGARTVVDAPGRRTRRAVRDAHLGDRLMTSPGVTPPDLQEALRADTQGVRTREWLALVERTSALVAGRVRTEHAPTEIAAAQQLRHALDATDRVLRTVWESLHGRPLE